MKKTKLVKLVETHIKDGMIKDAVHILRRIGCDSPFYARLYIYLLQMAVKLQNNCGPLSQDVYIDMFMLNFPAAKDTKGGVYINE